MTFTSGIIAQNDTQLILHINPVMHGLDTCILSDLSYKDRIRFAKFGVGDIVTPYHTTLIHAFSEQVENQPSEIAAQHKNRTITYKELDIRATQLAHLLKTHGVQKNSAVCLYIERSIEMLIGMVACGKLGAAYVPQHFGVTTEKTLRHISQKTGATVILTLEKFVAVMPREEGQIVIAIDGPGFGWKKSPLPIISTPEDLCMILFTSGTTGVPNGVQVMQKNLANIILTAPGNMGIGPGIKVGQILSISFDMAAWECWGCLANGGTLIIREKSIQDTAEKVDILISTPSILASLDVDRCQNIKAVAVAGEPCPRPLADRWAIFCQFNNSCGPTETTIVNTLARHYPEKDHLTIGKPTPNNTVYILDQSLKPLPIGEIGEMWAGGICVTAGYLDNDALNIERYVPDPFRPGYMMFRTRDLGQWTEDGELLHHGRVDDQIKVRGFRVELDSISFALEMATGCKRAAALKYDDHTLVAFVTPANVNTQEARVKTQLSLPYYAVPEHIFALESLPFTDRGKIDKRALFSLAEAILAKNEQSQ